MTDTKPLPNEWLARCRTIQLTPNPSLICCDIPNQSPLSWWKYEALLTQVIAKFGAGHGSATQPPPHFHFSKKGDSTSLFMKTFFKKSIFSSIIRICGRFLIIPLLSAPLLSQWLRSSRVMSFGGTFLPSLNAPGKRSVATIVIYSSQASERLDCFAGLYERERAADRRQKHIPISSGFLARKISKFQYTR
jgi:hypothetical protein